MRVKPLAISENLKPPDSSVFQQLEAAYNTYHRADYIATDPIRYPHRYKDRRDMEIVALYSAVLAYGNIAAIFKVLDSLLAQMGPRPVEWLLNGRRHEFERALSPLYHRFTTADDLVLLTLALQRAYRSRESLERIFSERHTPEDATVEAGASHLMSALSQWAGPDSGNVPRGVRYLLASPAGGSACKRLNLFLRWMVRRDGIDLGVWKSVSPSQLIMPLDVHILRISRQWGLLIRKSDDWKAALELTANLKRFSPADPVRYDFALTRLGMLGPP